jgi:hypothetical protein
MGKGDGWMSLTLVPTGLPRTGRHYSATTTSAAGVLSAEPGERAAACG